MKNAAIIGGSNFIGNYITLKFLAEDYHVKVQVPEKEKIKNDSVFKRISANRNLEVCPLELTNLKQINKFINDCEVAIHCGHPLQLDVKPSEMPVFVPLIRNTKILLNAIQSNTSLKKVIFITSAMAFNPGYIYGQNHNSAQNQELAPKNPISEKARFHAEKAVYNILNSFPEGFFEVVYISPVEVQNEVLSNSSHSTSLGLQFLFRKKITPDAYFEKLLKRQVIDRLADINELPERIFQAATQKTEPVHK
ncbi:MAG: NAD-dependent epimerase/dehydratase family protein [Tangfeifania sp.]